MKSILIVCLCMWGLLVYGEKNNTVHLYGSLKEFKAAEVNMAGPISQSGLTFRMELPERFRMPE